MLDSVINKFQIVNAAYLEPAETASPYLEYPTRRIFCSFPASANENVFSKTNVPE